MGIHLAVCIKCCLKSVHTCSKSVKLEERNLSLEWERIPPQVRNTAYRLHMYLVFSKADLMKPRDDLVFVPLQNGLVADGNCADT